MPRRFSRERGTLGAQTLSNSLAAETLAHPRGGGTGLLPTRDPPVGRSILQETPERLGDLGSAMNNAEARDSRLPILRNAPGRLESRPQPLKPRLELMGNSPRLKSRPRSLSPRAFDFLRRTADTYPVPKSFSRKRGTSEAGTRPRPLSRETLTQPQGENTGLHSDPSAVEPLIGEDGLKVPKNTSDFDRPRQTLLQSLKSLSPVEDRLPKLRFKRIRPTVTALDSPQPAPPQTQDPSLNTVDNSTTPQPRPQSLKAVLQYALGNINQSKRANDGKGSRE